MPAGHLDFLRDEFAYGRRFRVLNVADLCDARIPGSDARYLDLTPSPHAN